MICGVRNLRSRMGDMRIMTSTTKNIHVGSVIKAIGTCVAVNIWYISAGFWCKGTANCAIYPTWHTLFIINSVILHPIKAINHIPQPLAASVADIGGIYRGRASNPLKRKR